MPGFERDRSIDHLRALAMLQVILVHALYWGGFLVFGTASLVRSFCLFEMPLLFFVTGAANSHAQPENYLRFVYRRFKRILVPYWNYALICALLSIGHAALHGGTSLPEALKILLSWLIPWDRQLTSVSILTWALWYVPVYLCVVLLIPPMLRLKQQGKGLLGLLVLTGLFAAACILKAGWIQHVLFYGTWTFIGLYGRDTLENLRRRRFRTGLALTALAAAGGLALLYSAGQSIDMQAEKFPPSLTFALYAIMAMASLLLLMPALLRFYDRLSASRAAGWILNIFSMRSLTVFLYQPFAFLAAIRLAKMLPGSSMAWEVLQAVLCFVAAVILCGVLGHLMGRAEQLGKAGAKRG